jgi:hypothetical protein
MITQIHQYRFGISGGVISHNETTELLDVVSKLEVIFSD